MYRAGFLALGLFLILSGGLCFFVDFITLNSRVSHNASLVLQLLGTPDSTGRYQLDPPDWVPYTCIGIGMVTILYSIALPKD